MAYTPPQNPERPVPASDLALRMALQILVGRTLAAGCPIQHDLEVPSPTGRTHRVRVTTEFREV